MNEDARFTKSQLQRAMLLALGITGGLGAGTDIAYAAHQATHVACADPVGSPAGDNGNFTMLTPSGDMQGGTNDVLFTWDGTIFTSNSDYTGPGSTSNATLSSNQKFSGSLWTAHDVQIFGPGTYTFDPTLGGGAGESGTQTMTVGANQLGAHMLFDWGGNTNIDVAIVWNINTTFGACNQNVGSAPGGPLNCIWNGHDNGPASPPATPDPDGAANDMATAWLFSSADGNGNGIPGIGMPAGGPFAGFNANFNLKGALTGTTGPCAAFVDTTPAAFSFTPQQNAAFGVIYESNAITISGLGASPAAPNPATVTTDISVSNGEYAVSTDGGVSWSPFTTVANTPARVKNGDRVKVRGTAPQADGLTTNVTLTIGGVIGTFTISTPAIAGTQGSNFTMLDPDGGTNGGTNDVIATWDGTSDTNNNSTNFSRMTLSSTAPFSGYLWTAHHIRVFGPGSYTIDTTCTVAQLEAGISTNCNNPLQANPPQTQKDYTFTVGPNQIGAHMLFNWNNASNIDVVLVWNRTAAFGPSPMYTGPRACNSTLTVWDLMSTDWDGDGKNGGKMIDGAFPNFSANFNIRLPGTPALACGAYTPTVNVEEPSNSPGCSVSEKPVHPLERGDWWLIAGFIAWLAMWRRRVRQQSLH